MSWDDLWDNLPIVGTIRRFRAPWKGGVWDDYQTCILTDESCAGLGKTAAVLQCQNCIRQLEVTYIAALQQPPFIKDILQVLAGGVIFKIAPTLTANLPQIAKLLSYAGIILAGDALIDLAIYIIRLFRIKDAAKAAKANFCKC